MFESCLHQPVSASRTLNLYTNADAAEQVMFLTQAPKRDLSENHGCGVRTKVTSMTTAADLSGKIEDFLNLSTQPEPHACRRSRRWCRSMPEDWQRWRSFTVPPAERARRRCWCGGSITRSLMRRMVAAARHRARIGPGDRAESRL